MKFTDLPDFAANAIGQWWDENVPDPDDAGIDAWFEDLGPDAIMTAYLEWEGIVGSYPREICELARRLFGSGTVLVARDGKGEVHGVVGPFPTRADAGAWVSTVPDEPMGLTFDGYELMGPVEARESLKEP